MKMANETTKSKVNQLITQPTLNINWSTVLNRPFANISTSEVMLYKIQQKHPDITSREALLKHYCALIGVECTESDLFIERNARRGAYVPPTIEPIAQPIVADATTKTFEQWHNIFGVKLMKLIEAKTDKNEMYARLKKATELHAPEYSEQLLSKLMSVTHKEKTKANTFDFDL